MVDLWPPIAAALKECRRLRDAGRKAEAAAQFRVAEKMIERWSRMGDELAQMGRYLGHAAEMPDLTQLPRKPDRRATGRQRQKVSRK
jgi:hypothetical protein